MYRSLVKIHLIFLISYLSACASNTPKKPTRPNVLIQDTMSMKDINTLMEYERKLALYNGHLREEHFLEMNKVAKNKLLEIELERLEEKNRSLRLETIYSENDVVIQRKIELFGRLSLENEMMDVSR